MIKTKSTYKTEETYMANNGKLEKAVVRLEIDHENNSYNVTSTNNEVVFDVTLSGIKSGTLDKYLAILTAAESALLAGETLLGTKSFDVKTTFAPSPEPDEPDMEGKEIKESHQYAKISY